MILLSVSSVICLTTNSWVIIWVLLEINTLAFCTLIKTFSKEKKRISEIRIKYFIIQSVSSGLLLFSSISIKTQHKTFKLCSIFALIALLIKIASSPFQQWFVNIVKKSKRKNGAILITWQKLAPVYLVIYQTKAFVWPFLILSRLVGAISQINKKEFKEIIAFSSVFNLRWILLAITFNTKIFILFSLIYWISVIIIIYVVKKSKIKEIRLSSNITTKKWVILTVVLNLAGIPPLAGFLAKWIVFTESLVNQSIAIVTILLVIRRVNLYVYTRIINRSVINNTKYNQKSNSKSEKILTKVILTTNLTPILVLTIYRKRQKNGLFW